MNPQTETALKDIYQHWQSNEGEFRAHLRDNPEETIKSAGIEYNGEALAAIKKTLGGHTDEELAKTDAKGWFGFNFF